MQFVFFLLFIVAILICGSIILGPFSLRIYMTVIMLFSLLFLKQPAKERLYKVRTDYISIFLVCITMLGIALLLNDGLIVFGFLNRCLAYYLVCIVAYFAVDRYVKNEGHFDKIVFVLSLIVLFDTVVTILQYQNNPIGWSLGAIFSDVEEFATYLDEHDSFLGVSKLPGIFGHPVSNGFFLAVATPMLLTGIEKKNKLKALFYIGIIALSLLALIFLQQRAAFFLVLMFVAYHFLKTIVKNPFRFIVPVGIIVILILYVIPSGGGDVELGRLSTSDNSSRTRVWRRAFQVILENPLFGNPARYYQAAEYSAHNMLIDSLIDSGIFGFIPLSILVIKTVKDSAKITLKNNNLYARVFSYCVLISMAMGLFHNTSYLTGDVIIFITLALMFKSQLFTNRNQLKLQR